MSQLWCLVGRSLCSGPASPPYLTSGLWGTLCPIYEDCWTLCAFRERVGPSIMQSLHVVLGPRSVIPG